MAIRFTAFALAAAMLSAPAPTPASAAPAADGMSTTVRFADLDIATDAGAAALHRRIGYAAHAVCGDADPRDLSAFAEMQACRKVAVASADPQVQVALANARGGRQVAANDVTVSARGF